MQETIYVSLLLGGIVIGMVIEGLMRSRQVTAKEIAQAFLDDVTFTPPAQHEIGTSAHAHPIYGNVPYSVYHGDIPLYIGTNSDEAYKAWLELEQNPDKYTGRIEYYIGSNLHAAKD